MQAALPFFIADGAQSQGQQFLRLQYGINIAGITLRITKGSIRQRFGNAGRLHAQPACAGQADRQGCRFPRCSWPPRQFQTVRKSPPFPLNPSSQIPPSGCGRYCRGKQTIPSSSHSPSTSPSARTAVRTHSGHGHSGAPFSIPFRSLQMVAPHFS